MVLNEVTVDMEGRVEELEERVEEIESERDEIIQIANDRKAEGEEIDAGLENDFEEVQARLQSVQSELKKFQEAIDRWDGSKFTLKELAFGEVRRINDDMVSESFEVDVETEEVEGVPATGYYQMEMIRKSVKSTPPNAPTRSVQRTRGTMEVPAPGQYPNVIGEWLYNKVDNLNSTGEAEMGNSLSLQEAMNSADSEQS